MKSKILPKSGNQKLGHSEFPKSSIVWYSFLQLDRIDR